MKARHAAAIEKILDSAADIDLAEAAIPACDVAVVLLDAPTGRCPAASLIAIGEVAH